MDDELDDNGSDISLYEESDEESNEENYKDLNPEYMWTLQDADSFEFPHDIEPFEESIGLILPLLTFLLKKQIDMLTTFETRTTIN